jgi:hypothetical protein
LACCSLPTLTSLKRDLSEGLRHSHRRSKDKKARRLMVGNDCNLSADPNFF